MLFTEPFLLCGFSVFVCLFFTEPFLLCGFSVGFSSFCSSEVSFFGGAEDLHFFFWTFEETGRTVAMELAMQWLYHEGMTAHPIVTVLVVLVGRTQRDSRNALFTRSNAGYLQNAKDQLLHP